MSVISGSRHTVSKEIIIQRSKREILPVFFLFQIKIRHQELLYINRAIKQSKCD